MKQRNKKGFTLVELIIVIAIIGVLAGVLIPTFAGVIEKAKLASDQSDVKNMNTVVKLQSVLDDRAYYEAYEVKELLKSEGFVKLQSQVKGYSYWYDRAANEILLKKTEEIIGNPVAQGSMIAYADSAEFTQNRVEALSSTYPSYLYIDDTENEITNMVDTVNYLVRKAMNEVTGYANITAKMSELFSASYSAISYDMVKTHIAQYAPDRSLYIDETGFYAASEPGVTDVIAERVVFTPNIQTIPSMTKASGSAIGVISLNDGVLEIPASVTEIKAGAFIDVKNVSLIQTQTPSLLTAENLSLDLLNLVVGSTGANVEELAVQLGYYQVEGNWYVYETVNETPVLKSFYKYARKSGIVESGTANIGDVSVKTGGKNALTLGEVGATLNYINDNATIVMQAPQGYTTGSGDTLRTYTIGALRAGYLIPSYEMEIDTSVFKDVNKDNISSKISRMRFSSQNIGALTVMSGAVLTTDNTLYRLPKIGYFTGVSLKELGKGIGNETYLAIKDPTLGYDLAGLENLTVTLTYNDGTQDKTLPLVKDANGYQGYYSAPTPVGTPKQITIHNGTTVIFVQNLI